MKRLAALAATWSMLTAECPPQEPAPDRFELSVHVPANCAAPYSGWLLGDEAKLDMDNQARLVVDLREELRLDNALALSTISELQEKIRVLVEDGKRREEPPSRLEWFAYGASSVAVVAGAIGLWKYVYKKND